MNQSTHSFPNIELYNTLSTQKEHFKTVVPGKVGMYLCGPTVYQAESYWAHGWSVIFDTIKRHLVYSGWDVTWVVNITDVDDKLIAESKNRGTSMAALAEEMTTDYLDNLAALGVDGIDTMPKATDHIEGIIQFIAGLVDKDFAYPADGDVYFDVAKMRLRKTNQPFARENTGRRWCCCFQKAVGCRLCALEEGKVW